MLPSTDVFVIGGGPAGLAAAIAARHRGFRVVVADGVKPPIDKACGEVLMPDAITALDRLGVAIPAAEGCPEMCIRDSAYPVRPPFSSRSPYDMSVEYLVSIHPASDWHVAAGGGAAAFRDSCLQLSSRGFAATRGFPRDSGYRQPARRRPANHGFCRGHAVRAPVRAHLSREPDDLHEPAGLDHHRSAI